MPPVNFEQYGYRLGPSIMTFLSCSCSCSLWLLFHYFYSPKQSLAFTICQFVSSSPCVCFVFASILTCFFSTHPTSTVVATAMWNTGLHGYMPHCEERLSRSLFSRLFLRLKLSVILSRPWFTLLCFCCSRWWQTVLFFSTHLATAHITIVISAIIIFHGHFFTLSCSCYCVFLSSNSQGRGTIYPLHRRLFQVKQHQCSHWQHGRW